MYVTEAKRGLPEASYPEAMLKTRDVDSQPLMTSRCISDAIFLVALAGWRLTDRGVQGMTCLTGVNLLMVV